MSCHTWTYKKYNACTDKEKQEFLNECNKYLEIYLRPFEEYKESCKDVANMYMKHCEKGSKEYKYYENYGKDANIKKSYDKMLTKYQPFAEGLNDDNILNFCKIFDNEAECHIISNVLYINIDFDEPFRAYTDTDVKFTNKDKLLKWISTQNYNSIGYYDERHKNKWVEGYTVGLVERIENYFAKHGEDNLLIDFG